MLTPIQELQRFAQGAVGVEGLGKLALIELKRQVDGHVGDTGKLSKEHFAVWAASQDLAVLIPAAEAIITKSGIAGAAQPTPSGDSSDELAGVLRKVLSRPAGVDEAAVNAIIERKLAVALQGLAPHRIVVSQAGEVTLTDCVHPMFESVLREIAAGNNVLLVGPAGTGKTTLAGHVAQALKRQHSILHFSGGMSEADITGRLLPVKEGMTFDFVESDALRCYSEGNALITFDEIDRADSNTLTCAHAPLSNGHWFVQARFKAPLVDRGENVGFIATANTWGSGADRMYVGANQLDAATLNRWNTQIEIDYNCKLEEQLATAYALPVIHLAQIWEIRQRMQEANLRRIVSTRNIISAARSLQAGTSWEQILIQTITPGWTHQERVTVGVAK